MLDAILLPIGEGNRILAQISSGRIDELIAQSYKGDHEKMKQAVNNVAIVLQGLQKELGRLTTAAREGKLTERGDQNQFHGAYSQIVQGVNAILDAVISPLNVAANYVDRISKGDHPPEITDIYHGEFNTIKNNLFYVYIWHTRPYRKQGTYSSRLNLSSIPSPQQKLQAHSVNLSFSVSPAVPPALRLAFFSTAPFQANWHVPPVRRTDHNHRPASPFPPPTRRRPPASAA